MEWGLQRIFGMNNKKLLKPHQILLQALERKQDKNSAYSRRALARDVGVSAAFMSKVLTGQKPVPASRLKKICKYLDMDINAETLLKQAMLFHSLPSAEFQKIAEEGVSPLKMADYEPLSRKKFSVLRNWYNIAILDLLTCDVETSPKNIAKKFKLELGKVEIALKELEKEGLAVQEDGVWKKTQLKMSFPTVNLQTEVNGFHKQMVKKSYEELSKTKEESFESRLISGVTIAANPENIELVKKTIFAALAEVASQLSEGSCKEVYQFNVQLFPLTVKA